jgi:hypothetical protein
MKGFYRMKKKTTVKKGAAPKETAKPVSNRGGLREGAGRKAEKFSNEWWAIAEGMAHIQCTRDEICGCLDIDDETMGFKIIEKYGFDFPAWRLKFGADGKQSLRRRLYEMAINPKWDNTQAAIWLSKNYLGMKESISHDLGNKPIKFAYALEEDAK